MFSSQSSMLLMQTVSQSAELEMQMNAIERLKYFADLETEKQEGKVGYNNYRKEIQVRLLGTFWGVKIFHPRMKVTSHR